MTVPLGKDFWRHNAYPDTAPRSFCSFSNARNRIPGPIQNEFTDFEKSCKTTPRGQQFSSANRQRNCLCSGITLTAKGSTNNVFTLLGKRMRSSECMSPRQGRKFYEILHVHVSMPKFLVHGSLVRQRFLAPERIARYGTYPAAF